MRSHGALHGRLVRGWRVAALRESGCLSYAESAGQTRAPAWRGGHVSRFGSPNSAAALGRAAVGVAVWLGCLGVGVWRADLIDGLIAGSTVRQHWTPPIQRQIQDDREIRSCFPCEDKQTKSQVVVCLQTDRQTPRRRGVWGGTTSDPTPFGRRPPAKVGNVTDGALTALNHPY